MEYTISAPRDEWASMGPGNNSNPGVYFLISSGAPSMYTRSGVYLDPALKQSYTVCMHSMGGGGGYWGVTPLKPHVLIQLQVAVYLLSALIKLHTGGRINNCRSTSAD